MADAMAESSDMAVAVKLREDAVYHKRQSSKHRAQAREKMEELRRFCDSRGIAVELVAKLAGSERE